MTRRTGFPDQPVLASCRLIPESRNDDTGRLEAVACFTGIPSPSRPGKPLVRYPTLEPHMPGRINVALIRAHGQKSSASSRPKVGARLLTRITRRIA